jgi:hypothetical protein
MSELTSANIYKIEYCEECEWLLPVDNRDFERLHLDGRPRANSWQPITMWRHKLDSPGHPLRPCDFVGCSGGNILIMNETARRKLGSLLEKYGELLPLACNEGKFWVYNVTHFVDALDEHASDVLRASDEPDYILMIRKHIFDPAKLTGDWIFKIPQSEGRGVIYVTDPFVNLIRASGLTGIYFRRLWPHSSNGAERNPSSQSTGSA